MAAVLDIHSGGSEYAHQDIWDSSAVPALAGSSSGHSPACRRGGLSRRASLADLDAAGGADYANTAAPDSWQDPTGGGDVRGVGGPIAELGGILS